MQKIEYRHHPRFGAEIRVVRALKHFQDEMVTVQFADGRRLGLPRWMLDPETCQRLPQASKPRVAIEALLRLATLWETHRLLPRPNVSGLSVSSPRTEGDYAQRQKRASSSGSTNLPREGVVGQVSRRPKTTLPRAAAANAEEPGCAIVNRKETK